jgi:endogenous inhibitor of DNA gyrase (YacG/DUF329 family)
MSKQGPSAATNPLSEAARAMAAARRVVGPIQCAECGREVIATTAGRYKRRYCSATCKSLAHRHAHADEYNARQRARRAERRAEGTGPGT